MTGRAWNGAPRRTFRYRGDVSISYEVHGRGETPLVFLHGFAAALTTWYDIVPFFAPERFTLYLLDLKGFGRSSKPADGRYSVEEQASVVMAFLKELGLWDVVLAGHSLGGGIALLAWLSLRERGDEGTIGRLILIDCAAYPQRLPPIMRLLRHPLLGRGILHLLPVSLMVRYTLQQILYRREAITPERVARYVDSFGREGIDRVFIETCRQLVPESYAHLSGAFHRITAPTLIVWGREDRVIGLGHGMRLRDAIPGARLAVIDGCGHVPQEERPAETFAAILDFLDGSQGLQ